MTVKFRKIQSINLGKIYLLKTHMLMITSNIQIFVYKALKLYIYRNAIVGNRMAYVQKGT